ncbi:hypothetical protein F1188_19115 [Roseospira marina]|uniref:Uncharacterized protein n=1 Tax=Roseospira marina TaxID=140057 RepID=A0A5M6I695_9PROT|nr:hypothetical protein [Roseospira marina]KAA5603770.1 hypothetical protein F1188_19115 [Roseospira marina]MBB4316105.1 hypothetical protein [Roseospira marina]MBB5089271.1 hypothetical protein [Roseospira marina]
MDRKPFRKAAYGAACAIALVLLEVCLEAFVPDVVIWILHVLPALHGPDPTTADLILTAMLHPNIIA